jgi:hypothetical protein
MKSNYISFRSLKLAVNSIHNLQNLHNLWDGGYYHNLIFT